MLAIPYSMASQQHFEPSKLFESEAVAIHLMRATFDPHRVIGKSSARYHCKEEIMSFHLSY
jgi:hypothetical protein